MTNLYNEFLKKINNMDTFNVSTNIPKLAYEIINSNLTKDKKLDLFQDIDFYFSSQPIAGEDPSIIWEIAEELHKNELINILRFWSDSDNHEQKEAAITYLSNK